jgi:predicted GNAT family acetyltransferase
MATSQDTASHDSGVSVVDRPERHRFEAELSGSVAGYAEYTLEDSRIVFTHTKVDDEAEGNGVGSALASTALDAARERGLRVVPRCPFIARYISHHGEYLDLVDEEHRDLVEQAGG